MASRLTLIINLTRFLFGLGFCAYPWQNWLGVIIRLIASMNISLGLLPLRVATGAEIPRG